MSSQFESMTGKADYPFPEYDSDACDPLVLGQKWFQEAIDAQLNEPRSMVLATVNRENSMSSRVMAILMFTKEGILFATHTCSRKIQDVNAVPSACGHFYWREMGRQLSVSGQIRQLDRARAVIEWNKRPIPLHAMSTASRQSEPLRSSEVLLKTAEALSGQGALPCPDRYAVYVLEPRALQFWSSCSNRLHRRLRFERTQTEWECEKLQP